MKDTQMETLMANSHLSFAERVYAKIATRCVAATDGILGFDGGVVDSIKETFTREEPVTKGISVEAGDLQVALDLDVIIEDEVNAPAMYERLLEMMAEAIQAMTGKQLVELNLHVVDVMSRQEWRKQ